MSGAASTTTSGCPDEGALVLYLEGTGSEGDRSRIREHLDGCDPCRALVTALVQADPSAPVENEPVLPRGTLLGRYLLVDPLGRGAMGLVYRAYDPDLDRTVAVKVLRPDGLFGSADAEAGHAHLLAEAQAMARLNHPNVITVHDVGSSEGVVFFAMELVRGETLRARLATRRQRWRATLQLYLQAGEALAAAHEAGVVHRDFKPENVLVGDDGRVRVTDFGLAAHARATTPAQARVGTPAYMAPEQLLGQASAASDQYAFCVALHEALHGGRPLPIEGEVRSLRHGGEAQAAALAKKARAPKSAAPYSRPGVPAELSKVISRGLRHDPLERWPSMRALLDALARANRRVRPTSAALVALLGLSAMFLWGWHAVLVHRAELRLANAAAKLDALLAREANRQSERIATGLGAPPILAAFASATDLDAALGLAPRSSEAKELADAHELLRSADLPGLEREELVLLVNGWGAVLYDRADNARFGSPVPVLPLLSSAVRGQPGEAIWPASALQKLGYPLLRTSSGEGLYLLSARPVLRAQAPIGAALVGEPLDGPLLDSWSRELGVLVTIAPNTKPRGALLQVARPRGGGEVRRELQMPLRAPSAEQPPLTASFSVGWHELPGLSASATSLLRWALLLAFFAGALGIAYRGGYLERSD